MMHMLHEAEFWVAVAFVIFVGDRSGRSACIA